MKKSKNSKLLSNVKVSDADIKKYAKKLTIFGKKKVAAAIIGGVALVGGAGGAATYFAINSKLAVVENVGEIIQDPTVSSKDATIGKTVVKEDGSREVAVTSETRVIASVTITCGSHILDESEYEVKPQNDARSSLVVTIYKETYEKYGSTNSFKITPVFAEKCLVFFDSNGGSDVQPQSVEMGQKANKPDNPTKEDFEFLGWWYTNEDGEYVEFDFNNPINSNLILHAKWEVPITTEGVEYSYYEGKYYAYCDDSSKIGSVLRIPSKYKDPLTGIEAEVVGFGYSDEREEPGFRNCVQLEEVILPDTIEGIDENAFQNCSLLKKINIPEKVKYIDSCAFSYCKSLENIDLPNNLESIGYYAFEGTGLKKIIIPDSVRLLESGAFSSNENLAYVKLGNQINTIPGGCFEYCENLRQIILPISLSTISSGAFSDDSGLCSIIFEDKFSEWESSDGSVIGSIRDFCGYLSDGEESVYKKSYIDSNGEFGIQFLGYIDDETAKCAVQYIGHDENVVLDSELFIDDYEGITFVPTRIEGNFDARGIGIESVQLPYTITSIAPMAFFRDSYLNTITFGEENNGDIILESIGDNAFYESSLSTFNSTKEGVINLPESLTYLAPGSFNYCQNIKTVNINSDVAMGFSGYDTGTDDDYNDFWYQYFPFAACPVSKYTVNVGNSLYTTANTNALYSLADGDVYALIAYPYFEEEDEEKEISIAEGTVEILSEAFSQHNISSVAKKIYIPESLETFNDSLIYWDFSGETPFINLISFEVHEDNEYFSTSDDYATLFNKDKTELVKFALGSKTEPYTYDQEGKYMGNVIRVCEGAFEYDGNLTSIDLSNVKYIEYAAFEGCSLTEIDLKNIITISEDAFREDENIGKIIIGPNCTNINVDYAFMGVSEENCKMYIDSLIIANTKQFADNDFDWNFNFFKYNIYVKNELVEKLKSSSFIKSYYTQKETGDEYTHFLYEPEA